MAGTRKYCRDLIRAKADRVAPGRDGRAISRPRAFVTVSDACYSALFVDDTDWHQRESEVADEQRERELTVVIPAYNEEGRIAPTLDHVRAYLAERYPSSEVIVVDDGSRDRTPDIVRERTADFERSGIPLRLLGDGRNHGKGASVRTGMLAAEGRIVLFSDADLSAPIEETPKLVDPIRTGAADIAIGSRALDKSLIGVHQPASRELAGRLFNLAMRVTTGMPFHDTQCGFKAFRRDAARDVFARVRIERFGFDVETLFLACRLGYRVVEVPVVWNNVLGSKVSLFNGIDGFADLARVRWNSLRGLYDAPAARAEMSSVAE